MDKIEAVIFDFDGVIVDSEHLYTKADYNILNQVGIPLTEAEIHDRFVGLHYNKMYEILTQEYGVQKTAAYKAQINQEITALMDAELSTIQHVVSVISKLDMPYYIGSNTDKFEIIRRLANLKIDHLFSDNIIGGDSVLHPKPATDMFDLAAKKMGILPPNIVVIEDGIYGIMAAKQLGMKAFGFTGQSHPTKGHKAKLLKAGADLTFDDMLQLATLLKAS